jgi:hypothetical protein
MIAVDPTTGTVAVAWYDCRNAGSANKTPQIFTSISTDGGQTWLPNVQLTSGSSDITQTGNGTFGNDFGDYDTMDFYGGVYYPIWADNSTTLGNNPALPKLDIATARVEVHPGPAVAQLVVSGFPASTTAGIAQPFTVTALDAFGNTATGYTGTVHFTSTDGQAVVPNNYTFVAADNGVHAFSATLETAGTQSITATDTVNGDLTSTTGPVAVSPAAATHFKVTAASSATAGAAVLVTVTAQDPFNNTATSYTGTVHLTSSDGQAVLVPATSTLSNGVGYFLVTFATAGNQTVTATDTVTSSINGTSNSVAVGAAAGTHFTVSAPGSATAGTAFSFTVKALDAYGNTVTGYSGTVHFTSSDGQASLPANSTLTNGTGSFSATLKTAGSQTITATDTANSSITGSTSAISVSPGTTARFVVNPPPTATAGVAFAFSVAAQDAFNNPTPAYTGTVHFSSTDGQAGLPINYTFLTTDNGIHTFSATLKTAGSQTLTATDTASSSITGTSTAVAVSPAATAKFVVTAPSTATAGVAFSFTVAALDQFNNPTPTYAGTVHFTSTDATAGLPVNSLLANGAGTFQATLNRSGSQTLTATDTASSSITGASGTITVSPAAASHFGVSASPTSIIAGNAVTVTVTALDAFGNTATGYTGTVKITCSDPQAVLPANGALTNGVGNFSVTLKTAGSQTVTATDTVNPTITGTSATILVSPAAATHLGISAPSNAAAGSAFTITVKALDDFGNTATAYTGTVHFTKTDTGTGSAVPANYTFLAGDNGVHTFANGVTFVTLGNQTVTATDTANSSITGSATVSVSTAPPIHFTVSTPASATAGNPFLVTVTALDTSNNLVPNYSGMVHFTSTDSTAALPADSTLTNGSGIFIATLKTAGSQTITATDTVNSTITGTSGGITVSPAAVAHLAVSAPASATAGTAFSITVTAQDAFNNTVTGYGGTVHFTSTDASSGLPANSTLTNGTGSFQVTLKTAGSQTITTTDTASSGITGTSGPIAVSPAATAKFIVSASATAMAGVAISFTVAALDAFNNPTPAFAGIVHLTSSDPQVILPGDTTLPGGVGTFGVTLKTAGNQTITATSGSISGISGPIVVSPAAAAKFGVSASPASITAGNAVTLTVAAQDAFGNTATGYTGAVHLTSSDAQAGLPANGPLTNGVGNFSVTLKTAGSQTITATDTVTSSITGTSNPVSVSAAGLSRFVFNAPAQAITGTTFGFTATAADAFGNQVSGYAGTIHFSSTDTTAILPSDGMLTGGSGIFTATINKSGSQTLTATDTVNAGLTGSVVIAVRGLIVTGFTPLLTGFTASFSKAFINSSASPLNLYDAASAGYGAPDVTLIATDRTVVKGSLLVNATNTGFTFVKTGGLLAPGTYIATIASGPTAFRDTTLAPLDGNSDGINGDNYTTTFTVAAPAGVVASVPDFARGPDSTDLINVPNSSTNGIPITLNNAAGVTDATLVLQYNADLLTISSGVVNPTLTGATFTVATSGSGSAAQATITFHSPTALASGAVRLGGLVATVPANAPYKSKELLHWSSLALNGGAIPAVGDDGVHAVTFLGEASGDGVYTSADSVLLSRVAAAADSGFAAYPVLDPAIVGDITGDGRVTAADATALNLYLAGTSVPQVPTWPGVPSNLPAGPDPALGIPTDLSGSPGGTVLVPVLIDDPHPAGSRGLTQAVLALHYDPAVFSVSAADIHLGDVPGAGSGWTLQAVVEPLTGQIGIILFSATPITSARGGSLVTITFHVRPGARAGATPVNLVAEVAINGRVLHTALSDDQGPLTLHPAPTDATADPGIDGRILVTPAGPASAGVATRRALDQVFGDLAGPLLAVDGSKSSRAMPALLAVVFGDGTNTGPNGLHGLDPAQPGEPRPRPAATDWHARRAGDRQTLSGLVSLEELVALATAGSRPVSP